MYNFLQISSSPEKLSRVFPKMWEGRTVVKWLRCQFLGYQMKSLCGCPSHLASGTVDATISKLRVLYLTLWIDRVTMMCFPEGAIREAVPQISSILWDFPSPGNTTLFRQILSDHFPFEIPPLYFHCVYDPKVYLCTGSNIFLPRVLYRLESLGSGKTANY